MTVVQVHPDAASMELHMRIAAPAFRPFADLITLVAMDVYGDPSEALLEQLREKVRLLGTGTVAVHPWAAGFTRSGPDVRAARTSP